MSQSFMELWQAENVKRATVGPNSLEPWDSSLGQLASQDFPHGCSSAASASSSSVSSEGLKGPRSCFLLPDLYLGAVLALMPVSALVLRLYP